jgi:hypothetical protein
MIRGNASIFYTMARVRGYKDEEFIGCIVSKHGDEIVVDETHPDYPRDRQEQSKYHQLTQQLLREARAAESASRNENPLP